MGSFITELMTMGLSERLSGLRKEKKMTQRALADAASVHINSIKNYETEQAQPSVEALKNIALALHVSTDFLLFEEHERGPNEELSLQFEAVCQLPEGEQQIIKEVLDSLIIKYQTRRWDSTRESSTAKR